MVNPSCYRPREPMAPPTASATEPDDAGPVGPTVARPRRRGRRRRWWLGAILVVLVAWAAVVAVDLLRAEHHLGRGVAFADQARSQLSTATLADGSLQGEAVAARGEFAAAHEDVSGPWFTALRWVPILGTQVRSVSALSGAAETVAGAGAQALQSLHGVLLAPRATGAQRVEDMRRLAGTLSTLSERLHGVRFGPSRGVIGPLAAKRTTLATDVGRIEQPLTKAVGATSALARVLPGPGTYLMVATNNAEMRAGSGMMLEVGTLDVHDGKFTMGRFQPTGNLIDRATKLEPTGDLAARWGWLDPTVDFRELLSSPQFPANAQLAARMWQERTGQHVDGVVTVDVVALQELLGATGPVSVGGTTYNASTVTQQLLVNQYAGISETDTAADLARQRQQAALAAAVFSTVDQGAKSLTTLASAFDQAVDGRHVMVWAADAATERDWSAAGAGGAVDGDDLLLALLNQGANKLDPYQHVTAKATTTATSGATDVTVQVTVTNTAPHTLTGLAAGGGAGAPPARQYTGAVTLDVPASARRLGASGGRLEAAGADGDAQVMAVRTAVPDGATRTVTFRFAVPTGTGALTVLPSARAPASAWTWDAPGRPATRFDDDTAHTVPL